MTKKQDKGGSVAPGYCLSIASSQGVTNPHKISECFCSCHMPPKDMLSGFPCHTAHLWYSDLLLWWIPKRKTLREEIIILDQGFQVQSHLSPLLWSWWEAECHGGRGVLQRRSCFSQPLWSKQPLATLLVVIPYSDLSVLHPFLWLQSS